MIYSILMLTILKYNKHKDPSTFNLIPFQIKGPPIEFIKLDDVNATLKKVAKGEQRGRAVVKY